MSERFVWIELSGMIFFRLGLFKRFCWVYNKICMGMQWLRLMERSGSGMDCKDAEKKIPYFLQDELDGNGLEEFLEHVESCPDCKEELSIQFLVTEGLERLENGNNFNLQKELLMKLDDAQYRVGIHRILWYILVSLETAVALAIIIALYVVYHL